MNEVSFKLLLLPGFSLLSLGGFLDKIRFSSDNEDFSRQVKCKWTLVSQDSLMITSSCGVTVKTDCILKDLVISDIKCDYFVIFGGNTPSTVMKNKDVYLGFLKHIFFKKITIVSIDNAAFLLAAGGIIKRQILVHWRHIDEFESYFPKINCFSKEIILADDNIISSPGGKLTIELAVFLLERFVGKRQALKGLSDMLVSRLDEVNALSWTGSDNAELPDVLKKSIMIMRQNIKIRMSIDTIAQQCGISRRQLDRYVKKYFNVTSQVLYTRTSIEQACWLLLRTSKNISDIAVETGFTDLSHLNKNFIKFYKMPPGAWRRKNKKEMYS